MKFSVIVIITIYNKKIFRHDAFNDTAAGVPGDSL